MDLLEGHVLVPLKPEERIFDGGGICKVACMLSVPNLNCRGFFSDGRTDSLVTQSDLELFLSSRRFHPICKSRISQLKGIRDDINRKLTW